MKWREALNWFGGPIFAGFLVGMVDGYSRTTGEFEGFNWKTGLTIFVAFAILYLLVFVARLGVRYLLRRFRGPN
jgi:hypothetical protein